MGNGGRGKPGPANQTRRGGGGPDGSARRLRSSGEGPGEGPEIGGRLVMDRSCMGDGGSVPALSALEHAARSGQPGIDSGDECGGGGVEQKDSLVDFGPHRRRARDSGIEGVDLGGQALVQVPVGRGLKEAATHAGDRRSRWRPGAWRAAGGPRQSRMEPGRRRHAASRPYPVATGLMRPSLPVRPWVRLWKAGRPGWGVAATRRAVALARAGRAAGLAGLAGRRRGADRDRVRNGNRNRNRARCGFAAGRHSSSCGKGQRTPRHRAGRRAHGAVVGYG